MSKILNSLNLNDEPASRNLQLDFIHQYPSVYNYISQINEQIEKTFVRDDGERMINPICVFKAIIYELYESIEQVPTSSDFRVLNRQQLEKINTKLFIKGY